MKSLPTASALLLLLLSSTATAAAQSTFTAHLTRATARGGRVVLMHDAEIAALVDGVKPQAPQRHQAEAAPRGQAAPEEHESHEATAPRRQRVRTSGYRIQIFTGSNSRADKVRATAMGEKCRQQFPQLGVYPHYYNPRWTCRVGDFRTREEAQDVAEQIRAARISNEVRIVACEVLLPPTEE